MVAVNTDQDVVDPSDQLTSLREAIEITNHLDGPDEIVFDLGQDQPSTIRLEMGELAVTDGLTIRGPGSDMLTIDARGRSRVFNITTKEGDFTVQGVTLSNGRTRGSNAPEKDTFNGGAIRSTTAGTLTLDHSVVMNSRSDHGDGGGVFALGRVSAHSSKIIGNETSYDLLSGSGPVGPALGGGIRAAGDVEIVSSTISHNTGVGVNSLKNITVTTSTISENDGPGLLAWGNAKVVASTISRNSITGDVIPDAIFIYMPFSFVQGFYGGGIRASDVTVDFSTIVDNVGGRGGILADNLSISNSIVAGNKAIQFCLWANIPHTTDCDGVESGQQPSDLSLMAEGTWDVSYSLIGHNWDTNLAEANSPDANGNLIGGPATGGIDPRLAPLADNGGPTKTHALLPDSPTINMGDPSGVIGGADLPRFDQRGEPYSRVVDGRIDIGAFERGVPGDANGDGKVNFVDFLILANHFGTGQGWAEGNFDGSEDGTQFLDFVLLANNFGYEQPAPGGVAAAAHASVATLAVAHGNHGIGRSRPELIGDLLAGHFGEWTL